jgi:hypothetical protein
MLHRAHVYNPSTGGSQWPEVTVFFEAPLGAGVTAHLQALVASVWGVPPQHVQAYNISDESELRRMWDAPAHNSPERDLPLLQVGDGPDGPIYSKPGRTQYLVGPTWLQRLHYARERIDLMLAGEYAL